MSPEERWRKAREHDRVSAEKFPTICSRAPEMEVREWREAARDAGMKMSAYVRKVLNEEMKRRRERFR